MLPSPMLMADLALIAHGAARESRDYIKIKVPGLFRDTSRKGARLCGLTLHRAKQDRRVHSRKAWVVCYIATLGGGLSLADMEESGPLFERHRRSDVHYLEIRLDRLLLLVDSLFDACILSLQTESDIPVAVEVAYSGAKRCKHRQYRYRGESPRIWNGL
ncbi:hypothetical protein OE88DRAFT_1662422 [Heliocybe sulcata]|uniref:Uncharacterized protein n=1 Tax=Heliocybe sulcata TaxID=5364 RepID=A0A5C3N151_9AGAM|nr:hypothetical protein OE88DRAFT_1662422 [Heliocybe sulcata]